MWTEVEELAVLLRSGDVKWEDLDLDDVDVRMKWSGLFHRGKRTPGKFMQRLKVSQGVLSSEQLRALGSIIARTGQMGAPTSPPAPTSSFAESNWTRRIRAWRHCAPSVCRRS